MKAYIRTYGCRANQYDTEVVRSLLRASSVEEVHSPDDADVAIFNSCTVTAAAEADLRADARRARSRNPRIRSIVMGCAAAVPDRDESRAPLRSLPGVDTVIGGASLDELALALGVPLRLDSRAQTGARGLLRIQDGCDEHCTFCATTMSRGSSRSRPIEHIVDEAKLLAGLHPEIVITGIHIGAYGRDNGSSLGALVERLVQDAVGVRFRLTSIEATEVDDRLRELMTGDSRRVAPHLHAPLQSGSDRVLRRMGRHWYTARSYAEHVDRIAARVSPFALSGDVIAGFPGESEDDHRETMGLIESLPFSGLHVFPYSPRPGTPATRLGGHVDAAVVRRRARELRELGAAKAAAYEKSRVAQRCDVVVVERGKGLTEDYLSVAIADASVARRSRFDGLIGYDGGTLTAIGTSAA